ncbi:MAG: methylmalonyl-CoA mutase [Myxococcaceae bacterium]|nr:methylmalonyl-CoA mutase [Myxococcaceae bacterium]
MDQGGEQPKLNEFEPVSYEAWLKLVERDLQGAPFEKKLVKRIAGIDVRPLYVRSDAAPDSAGLPGSSPYTRGSYALGGAEMGWDVRHEVAAGEPDSAAASILESLNGEVSSLALVLDRAARAGNSEHGQGGIAIENVGELSTLLADVLLDKISITLEAGATGFALAAGLVAVAKRKKLKLETLSGSFGIDPLGTLATFGSLPCSLESALSDAGEVAGWASSHAPRMRALTVDTSAYHEAGADAALEVAIALASGVEYLRALTRAGLSVDQAAQQILFRFSVGRDFFLEIAKLRAARRTWARVVEAAGGSSEAQTLALHARTSRRTKTQRDPWVNLLRGTAESFSAALGGADAITTEGFDAAIGDSDEFAQRMARNTQHLLRHESHVHRVVDPAGGSWYIESLTEQLAQRAWQKLQSFERAGGLTRALVEGSLQQELKSLLESERKAVETRKVSITGVNEFPFVNEPAVLRPSADGARATERAKLAAERSGAALSALETAHGTRFTSAIASAELGAAFSALRAALSSGTPAKATALLRERLAQPFETLRDRADRALAKRGERPRAFLANLGPIPEHKARAGYAQNFVEAGGFVALTNLGFLSADAAAEAFRASGAEIAVLCSSDAVYAELATATAQALQKAGARAIVLAGSPGDQEAAYRAAGVTDFIFVGINAVDTLRSLLERAGAQ